jgi:hypothetical protein
VAVLTFVCWAGAVALEFAIGPHIAIIIAANVVAGIGLLIVAAIDGARWLFVMIALEAAMLVLHALTVTLDRPPGPIEVIGNNVLVTLGLLVMVGAAVAHRLRTPQPRTMASQKV